MSIPIYGQVDQRSLIREADSLASQSISERFRQNPSLNMLEMTILGERNGEVIPIFSVLVSRDQWQENPQASAWAEYSSASYALLRRHEEATVVASSPSRNAAPVGQARSFAAASEVQSAYDQGRLSGVEAQFYSDELD